MQKLNSNPNLLNLNHSQSGNLESIINASKSIDKGEFGNAVNEINEVINELNSYAADLMNKIEHHQVEPRYPDGGPKKSTNEQ